MNHIEISMLVFTIDELVQNTDCVKDSIRNQLLHRVNVCKIILEDEEQRLKLEELNRTI